MSGTSLRKRMFSLRTVSILTVCVLAAAAGTAVWQMHRTSARKPSSGTASAGAKSRPDTHATGTASQPSSGTTTAPNVSDADKQAAAHAAAQPVTDACTLLTLAAAQQIIGSGAAAATASDTSSLQASGTAVTACAYASGNNTVQLTIRKATNQLGTSENATAFGSGRPAGAVTVQGYGQSAYWDPDKHTLNVLGSNNWYIISRSAGTQAASESAAQLLEKGF